MAKQVSLSQLISSLSFICISLLSLSPYSSLMLLEEKRENYFLFSIWMLRLGLQFVHHRLIVSRGGGFSKTLGVHCTLF